MIKLNAKDVQKAFEKLGFTVKQINDTAYRCEHKQYINVNFIIDAVNKELQISAYFTGKKTVDRNEFLTALNTCNRRTTIVKFMVDDDGDLYLRSCVPGPSGGFEYDVLEHIIKEFQNEIRNNLSLIQPFVE
jgi:hypothetical protein